MTDLQNSPQPELAAAPPPAETRKPAMSAGLRWWLDFSPALIFFVTFFVAKRFAGAPVSTALDPGLMWATLVFMAATAVSLAVSYVIERKVHAVPLVTAAIVMVFGGLTLVFQNDTFIKMKPTIIYLLLAGALLGGLKFNRLFIKQALGNAFDLTDEGWRQMTLRWGLFLVALALLNEVLRRVLTTEAWLFFKVWGLMAIIFVFSLWQALTVGVRHKANKEIS